MRPAPPQLPVWTAARQRLARAPLWAGVAMLTLALACRGREPAPDADTSLADTVSPAGATTPWSGSWTTALGEVFVVPADTDAAGVVLYPDAPPPGLSLTLWNPGGDAVSAKVSYEPTDSLQCGAPIVRLTAATNASWTVGLQAGGLAPIRLDSVEALSAADSARLVANLARLASALTAQRPSRFSGLPFTVLTAYRFGVANRPHVVARLVRRLHQEAAPMEEHMLLVADRAVTDSMLGVRYSERSEGSEETVEQFAVLAVAGSAESAVVLLTREQASRTVYEIVERSRTGEWRLRWSRALTC